MNDEGRPTYLVRPAQEVDLPAIAEIYNAAILNSVATFDMDPWTPEEARQWLVNHSHPYVALIAAQGTRLVGWASLSPFRSKPAYLHSAENSVYVREDMLGRGVGAALMGRLMEAAAGNGFRTVIARITAGNPASERLHARFGFRHVGVEREVGYKFGRWLDVVVMQAMVGE
jgi:phosphinothricin acetyltransferase